MTVEANAKVNLTLEVFGKRSDGYHDLRSVVLPISLADTLVFESAVSFSTDTGYADDLILKAARVLSEGRALPAFHVTVTKRIPAGGGLGGGSADAAATLRVLNERWQLGKTPEELAKIGAAVGSDVPPLVLAQHYGSPVLMEGRGERVSRTAVDLPSPYLVLANPGVHSSTPAVYAKCAARVEPATDAVNDLELPAVALYPEIGETLAALREAGAEGVRMTGSGATVFGFAESAAEAERMASAVRARGCPWVLASRVLHNEVRF